MHRTTDATVAAAAAGQPTRTVLVIGSIHGDEQAGLRVIRRLRDRDSLPIGLDLWLLRTVNPDGTVHDVRTNAHGVDLNRNFPYLWHRSPRGATWSGTRPLSEPESVLLHDLVLRLQPDLTLVFHQPLFGVGASDKGMPMVRALAAVQPDQLVVQGCRFSCDPSDPDPACPDGPHVEIVAVRRPARLVELPVGATEDRVIGSLDLQQALGSGRVSYEPGLLAAAAARLEEFPGEQP